MFPLIKKLSKKARSLPETPVHTGERKVENIKVNIFRYNGKNLEEELINIPGKNSEQAINQILNSKLLRSLNKKNYVHWINVKGLHDVELIKKIGDKFEIHNLSIEDILNTAARPKIEEFDDYLFIVLQSLRMEHENTDLFSEQVSILVKNNCVLSFQEGGEKIFTEIKERIRSNRGRIRRKGADYLAYAIMDKIVDRYFMVFEEIAEQMESIEDELLEKTSQETLQRIHALKNTSLQLRKAVWPLREIFRSLTSAEDMIIIKELTVPFFRDVQDHVIQIMDIIESIKEMLTSMHDMYLSSISNRMNEIMKVLTIIATIFMPLTFLAGIYGMNFKYMPELEYKDGYFIVLGIMVLIGILMVFLFKKKKWL